MRAAAGLLLILTLVQGCDRPEEVSIVEANVDVAEQAASDNAYHSPSEITWIEFADDVYLTDLCSRPFMPSEFQRFSSRDFIYDAPAPITVSGEYLEVPRIDYEHSGGPGSVYFHIVATIFRDPMITVDPSYATMPRNTLADWSVRFSASDYPFNPHRQLRFDVGLGTTFPIQNLQRHQWGDYPQNRFVENFISVMNILSLGLAEDRREFDFRLAVHAISTGYEPAQRMTGDRDVRIDAVMERLALTVGEAEIGDDVSIGMSGESLVLKTNGSTPIIVAIATSRDAVGFQLCSEVGD